MTHQYPKGRKKKYSFCSEAGSLDLNPESAIYLTVETVSDFIFLGSKITADGDAAMKLKDAYSLEGKL